jgi:hypothetical protein
MMALVVMRWARSREVPWLSILLLLLACGWTALVSRMVSSGAIIVAPLLAKAMQDLIQARRPWNRADRSEMGALGGAAIACLALLGLLAPATADHPAGVPSAFTGRLASLPPDSAVAVEDGTGAWIEYRFQSLNPVIDGMLDAYPVGYVRDFYAFREVKPGWQRFLARSGARVAVVRVDSALTAAMRDQLHWKLVQEDGDWVYLVAPATP